MLGQRFSFFFAGGIKVDSLPVEIDVAVMVLDGDGVSVFCSRQGAHGFKNRGKLALHERTIV